MRYSYLFSLIISLSGLSYLDYKKQLAWFWNYRRTGACMLAGVSFFLIWDMVGIAAGIFSTNQRWVSGLHLGTPNLPVEELLFLVLLNYLAILLWRWRCLATV